MYAPRKMIALANLVVLLGASAGAASAEPKNQWPFTRSAGGRTLTQAVRSGGAEAAPRPEPKNEPPFTRVVRPRTVVHGVRLAAVDAGPRPEPKNEPPFTNLVGQNGLSHATAGATATVGAGGSGGIDWALGAWGSLVAITLVGGAVALRRSALFTARNHAA
jgi:hypothetical protein